MNSQGTHDFWERYRRLPREVRNVARRAYVFWKADPRHGSLQFKKLKPELPFYSVRVGQDYRAVGLLEGDTVYWDFIGTHAEYDHYIAAL